MRQIAGFLACLLLPFLGAACGPAGFTPTGAIAIDTRMPARQRTPLLTGQDELKDKWRFPYGGGLLLVNTCRMMLETQMDFLRGEIDLAGARAELEREAGVITLVDLRIAKEVPSEHTGALIWELDLEMRSLIEIWSRMQAGELGAPEIRSSLEETCTSLEETTRAAASSAAEQGMTEASRQDLELEAEEILDELVGGMRNE